MSVVSIAPYCPFRRIKIINQQVLPDASEDHIQAQPDKALLSHLSMLRQISFRHTQLDAAQDPRFKPGKRQSVAYLSISTAVLCQLPSDQHRRSELFDPHLRVTH